MKEENESSVSTFRCFVVLVFRCFHFLFFFGWPSSELTMPEYILRLGIIILGMHFAV